MPEDRGRPTGRQVEVVFTVLPAQGEHRRSDPVVVLLGGPGDAASPRLTQLAAAHAFVNAHRDLIFVDQRGTGRSSPLDCTHGSDDDLQSYMDFLPIGAVRACIAALQPRVDFARYGTGDFVADLEDLRAALGIDRWNLHGTSYGTRVALHYLARHPRSIRSAVLAGVVPPEFVMPVPFAKDADRALQMLIADCRADSGCAAAFPGFAQEIDSVARRLERAPAVAEVIHPVTGARGRVLFSRAAFGEVVRAALYQPASARRLPLEIHEAYLGDYSALATAHVRRQRMIALEGWTGLYLAVTCPEDLARADEEIAIAESRGTILGDYRARQHFAACAEWPGRPRSDASRDSGRIRTPVLMIVGEQDPATAPRWAELALKQLERGQLVTVPSGGHGFAGMIGRECLERLQADFFSEPLAAKLDTRCAAHMRRLPFVTSR